VANPRKVRLIYKNRRKNDAIDAMYLARLARTDPALLAPIHHRGQEAQKNLAMLRGRDALVKSRAQLINHVRGAVKATGKRLPRWGSEAFARKATGALPPELVTALGPVIEVIARSLRRFARANRALEVLAEAYPETLLLRQVKGSGRSPRLPSSSRWRIQPGLPRAVPLAHTWVWSQRNGIRASPSPNSASARKVTPSSDDCWWQRSVHSRVLRRGLRPATSRYEAGRQRIKERQETSRGRRCTQAGRPPHRLWQSQATYDPLYTPNELSARASLPERNKRRHRGNAPVSAL